MRQRQKRKEMDKVANQLAAGVSICNLDEPGWRMETHRNRQNRSKKEIFVKAAFPVNEMHCNAILVGVFSSSRRCSDAPIHISCIPTFGRYRTTSYLGVKLSGSWVGRHGLRHRTSQVGSTDEGLSSFDVWGDDEGIVEHMLSSSDDEENEGEVMGPVTDVDLPTTRELTTGDSFAVTSHRFAMLRRGRRRSRIKYGVINNIGLLTFLTALLLFVDWCAWRIVRLPLESFYLMRPFCISAVTVSCVGYVCVPLLRGLKILAIIRKEGPSRHFSKRRTPTMGGLFLVPIGIIVAEVLVGFSSTEVSAAAAATLAFSAIGLLDDILSNIKNHNNGLSAKMRMLLELAVGSLFSFWLDATKISSPYSMYTIL